MGGAIYLEAHSSEITPAALINSKFISNTAYDRSSSGVGGGIYAGNVEMAMTNCTLGANSATNGGGLRIDASSASATIVNSIF